MKRYHAIIEGTVQGVGMRSFCIMQAQQRNLTGTVRNMSNGMVEVYVQGEEAQIDDFFKAIRKGTRFVRVSDITMKEVPVVENEKRFTYGR